MMLALVVTGTRRTNLLQGMCFGMTSVLNPKPFRLRTFVDKIRKLEKAVAVRNSLLESEKDAGQDFHFLLQTPQTQEGFLNGVSEGFLKGF